MDEDFLIRRKITAFTIIIRDINENGLSIKNHIQTMRYSYFLGKNQNSYEK